MFKKITREDEAEVLKKAIKGERPINKNGVYLFSNRWHKVIYKNQEGYIYSEALEIDNENKEEVQRFIIEKSKELNEDADLMLAIAEQESNFHPYRVSYNKDNSDLAFGIMQITHGAIKQVEDDYQYKVIDKFNLEQNIEGGIRYFQYLRTLYNKGESDYLRKLLASWNWGPANVIKYKGKELILNDLDNDIQIFIKNVKIFYNRNKQKNRNSGFTKILLISLVSLLFLTVFGYVFLIRNKRIEQMPQILGASYQIITDDINNIEIFQLQDDLDNDGKLEKINFNSYFSEHDRLRNTEVELNNSKVLHLGGWFWGAYTKDIDKDNVKEVIIELTVGMNGIWTEVYNFQDGKLKNILMIDRNNNEFFGFLGIGIDFIDYDNDQDLELESMRRFYDVCDPKSEIYEYIDGKFIFKKAIMYSEKEKIECREAMEKFRG